MVIARAMGSQGIVSRICPIHVEEQSPEDPPHGYRPAVTAIVTRVSQNLAR